MLNMSEKCNYYRCRKHCLFPSSYVMCLLRHHCFDVIQIDCRITTGVNNFTKL